MRHLDKSRRLILLSQPYSQHLAFLAKMLTTRKLNKLNRQLFKEWKLLLTQGSLYKCLEAHLLAWQHSGTQHDEEYVLFTWHGVGATSARANQFMAILDHDVPFRLGFIPTKADYRYMARLHKEKRALEPQTHSNGIIGGLSTVQEHGTFSEIRDIVDGVIPHNEYIDEMLAMSMIQIEEIVKPELTSPFDLFGFEGVFDFVDPPLSFDVLSGFVSHFDDIFDIDDEIAQHDSYDDSSSASDSNLIDQRVSPTIEDTEVVDFSTTDQPRNYPEWLANVVPVSKKDGQVRVCVDFRDLNKIALEDMEKTSFITEWGTYCYRVMPFELKNVEATYQKAATTLFHDMMHRNVEVYVDDMIVKSRDRADHLAALERFFEKIRQFKLRLNPKKWHFWSDF
ncbi:Retrovirus-related Pol polyprotein from transposon 17.6 [Vitis vinifera]|uniref:Retrovirus-related Pol polyprotein from transposon 17.6 n=1 Tax=Vitis vinifera TaxID=29760 RepID=A0A438G9N9_VITVI|nr:Retrovirus-related Pol polyprotein from transposon 17.6 [Vitis vinifera]